jgi:hypothetical protein
MMDIEKPLVKQEDRLAERQAVVRIEILTR